MTHDKEDKHRRAEMPQRETGSDFAERDFVSTTTTTIVLHFFLHRCENLLITHIGYLCTPLASAYTFEPSATSGLALPTMTNPQDHLISRRSEELRAAKTRHSILLERIQKRSLFLSAKDALACFTRGDEHP